jgi:exodeoxyribonuclease VII large subunit
MNKEFISLYELTSKIKQVIDDEFQDSLWIIAEISELNINQRGHCYLNLIEKDAINDTITAQVRATIWASQFRMLKPYFESTTGVEFTAGLKILTKVSVSFHEQYGFSLNIRDIDPSFTIGELELKRKQTIEQLKQDGVFYLNKEISFPDIPKNIAVISSATAAGYGDFVNQIENNDYGFKFNYYLFN